MAWDGLEPTIYELRGDGGTQVSYTSDPRGRGRLFYAGPHGERTYPDDEIDARDTELGREVTVTLHVDEDAESVNLTLLIPPVRVGGGGRGTARDGGGRDDDALAGPPPTGQDYRYEVVALRPRAPRSPARVEPSRP